MASAKDYFTAYIMAGGGTADPNAAGLGGEFESPPPRRAPAQAPARAQQFSPLTAVQQYWDYLGQRDADNAAKRGADRMAAAPGQWGDTAPPIPGPQDMPNPPPAPVPQFGTGDPQGSQRILARLSRPPEVNAKDLGIDLLGGPQTGQYGALRNSMPAAASPVAATPALATAPVQPARSDTTGAGIQGHLNELRPMFAGYNTPPASTKPDFHDNLLRFGLAAMAAGGKPGATTLGALGEAGLSTVDAQSKAKQSDIDNLLSNRKLSVQAQDQISRAYERLDTLRQRAEAATASQQDKLLYQEAQRAMQLLIANMQNDTRQDAIGVQRDALGVRRDDLADKAADRKVAAEQARLAEDRRVQHEVGVDDRGMAVEQQKLPGNIGKSPVALRMERWSTLPSESRQGQAYAKWLAEEPADRADALAAIAKGQSRTIINKRRQDAGYDPLP